jgi:hypothetical protein
MAVTVTDTRITVSDADDATGWTTAVGAAGYTTVVEPPKSIIPTRNIATGQFYFTGTSRNLSDTLIYVWGNNFALQDTWTATDPPLGLHIGDGTNRVSFRMSGRDKKVFAHLEGQLVDWECLVLDGSLASTLNSAGRTIARAGSFASLNLNAITQIGCDFTTLSKGLGGGVNVAVDIIRVGNDGIRVTGGTTGDRGKFSEIVTLDRSTASGRAHGLIRQYTQGLYGVQGPINFGTITTGDSWFDDANFTLVFEDRDIANNKYYIAVAGTAGSATHFILNNGAISTAGPWVRLDFSSGDINTLTLTNNTFRNLFGTVDFATDTAAESHTVTGNTWVSCGAMTLGAVNFNNNVVTNSGLITTGTGTLTGTVITGTTSTRALLWNVNTSTIGKLDNTRFDRAGATAHAIEFGPNTPSEITLSGITFVGYGADETTTATIYNNSGKAITINMVAGSTTPTIRNGTGASTELVVGLTTITLSGLQENTEIVVLDASTNDLLHSIENTDVSGEWSFVESTGVVVNIYVHNIQYEWLAITNYTIPSQDATLPIEQRFDRNYNNPPGGP